MVFSLRAFTKTLDKLVSTLTCHVSIVCIVEWLSHRSSGQDESVRTRLCLILEVTRIKIRLNRNFFRSRNDSCVMYSGSSDQASRVPVFASCLRKICVHCGMFMCASVCLVSQTTLNISMRLFIRI